MTRALINGFCLLLLLHLKIYKKKRNTSLCDVSGKRGGDVEGTLLPRDPLPTTPWHLEDINLSFFSHTMLKWIHWRFSTPEKASWKTNTWELSTTPIVVVKQTFSLRLSRIFLVWSNVNLYERRESLHDTLFPSFSFLLASFRVQYLFGSFPSRETRNHRCELEYSFLLFKIPSTSLFLVSLSEVRKGSFLKTQDNNSFEWRREKRSHYLLTSIIDFVFFLSSCWSKVN